MLILKLIVQKTKTVTTGEILDDRLINKNN